MQERGAPPPRPGRPGFRLPTSEPRLERTGRDSHHGTERASEAKHSWGSAPAPHAEKPPLLPFPRPIQRLHGGSGSSATHRRLPSNRVLLVHHDLAFAVGALQVDGVPHVQLDGLLAPAWRAEEDKLSCSNIALSLVLCRHSFPARILVELPPQKILQIRIKGWKRCYC